jgi:hypothetical protein
MLKKVNWPLMNADERGFEDAKAFVFNLRLSAFISVYQRPTLFFAFSTPSPHAYQAAEKASEGSKWQNSGVAKCIPEAR